MNLGTRNHTHSSDLISRIPSKSIQKNLCPIITKAEIFSCDFSTGILLYHFIDSVMLEDIIPKLLHKRARIPVFQHSHIYVTAVMKILDI